MSWLAHLVTDQLEIERTQHLVRISGTAERPRTLYAVHGEFGNIVSYRDLAAALGDDWSLVGIQASGVHGTRPLHHTIEDMAEAYLSELRDWQPEGPYLLAGYSAGGTIAYEMARQLRAGGHEVEALIWFDHYRMGATKDETIAERALRLGRNRLKVLLTDTAGLRAGIERRRLSRLMAKLDVRQSDQWWMEITRVATDQADAEHLRSLLISKSVQDARQTLPSPSLRRPDHPLPSRDGRRSPVTGPRLARGRVRPDPCAGAGGAQHGAAGRQRRGDRGRSEAAILVVTALRLRLGPA